MQVDRNEQFDSGLASLPSEVQIGIYKQCFELETPCVLKALRTANSSASGNRLLWQVRNNIIIDPVNPLPLLLSCKKIHVVAIEVLYAKTKFEFQIKTMRQLPRPNSAYAFPRNAGPLNARHRFIGLRNITFSVDANNIAVNKPLVRAMLHDHHAHPAARINLKLTLGQSSHHYIDVNINVRDALNDINTAIRENKQADGGKLRESTRFHLRRFTKTLMEIAEEDARAKPDAAAMVKLEGWKEQERKEKKAGLAAWKDCGDELLEKYEAEAGELFQLGALMDAINSVSMG